MVARVRRRSRAGLAWYQFSLRGLMLSVAACAMPLSWFAARAERVRREERCARLVQRLGGGVCYDYECDESNRRLGGARPPGPKWLRSLQGDQFLASVACAHVKGPEVTDAVLAKLCDAFPDLELLDLERAGVTDAGLAHLERVPELQSLDLDSTRVTDAGLAHLRALPRLRRLYLCHTEVTDAGLKNLAGLEDLRELYLDDTRITDDALVHLGNLPRLEYLSLASTGVTDAGLAHLDGLTHLKELCLRGCAVSRGAVGRFRRALPQADIRY